MYNKYVIFFYEDDEYKMINYVGSFMAHDLAKIIICSIYLKMKYKDGLREKLEDEFIKNNLITYNGKQYRFKKFIKKRGLPFVRHKDLSDV